MKGFYHIWVWWPSWSCDHHHVIRFSFLEFECYIPSFVEIGPPVLEKKIFEWFLPYMGVAAILVM